MLIIDMQAAFGAGVGFWNRKLVFNFPRTWVAATGSHFTSMCLDLAEKQRLGQTLLSILQCEAARVGRPTDNDRAFNYNPDVEMAQQR